MVGKYNFSQIEPEILKYWEEHEIYRKREGPDFYFLDGPPYTSGKVHLGTAWNKALKDMVLRYKRMKGFNVWDRAGYDMHGLPTAHKVMEKHDLKDKQDIEMFGVDKFIEECKKFSIDNMHLMTADFKRLGVWMDFDNAYQPISKEYIEGEWWLIKKAHENGRLYEGERTMTWCATCQTALAKHELEYRNVTDKSIFVKFKLKERENEYLIIWTTTPWTIPFNLAVMVNPEVTYVRAKVEDEIWVVAKALAGVLIQSVAGKKFEVVEELQGDKLEGLEYEHPFADQIEAYAEMKKDMKKIHTILLSSEYVDTTAGSGLVHCAPGCGPEDYEVGHKNEILPYNTIDEQGVFDDSMGKFSGWVAKKNDDQFIQELEDRGALIASTDVEHDYAHCWRSHDPVIYRTTRQWFFKVEDLKEQMLEENKKIRWVPDAAFNAFESWLKNLRDNSITRQRYWGTPLPVWRCECGKYEVIGNVAELEERSGQKVEKLHKPWIDDVRIPCDCGKQRVRIPDILDVWVDAGTASWNCLYFPHKRELFDRLFPADFILEGKDQIRGWFNLLMVASMVAMGRPSFKNVYMHGFVQDARGRKMSKSLGNYISPEEVIGMHGADVFRYYMIGGANPGVDINYNDKDIETKAKILTVIWNLHKYLVEQCALHGIDPTSEPDVFDLEEKYILSRMNNTIKKGSELMDSYSINDLPALVEALFLDLSRTYIQLVRDKEDQETVMKVIYRVFLENLKMFSIIAPFVSEKMFLNIKEAFKLEQESITHFDWPEFREERIDEALESTMAVSGSIVQAALYAREKAQQGIRWPLQQLKIVTTSEDVVRAVEQLGDIIKKQVNVREIDVTTAFKEVKVRIKADAGKIGHDFGDKTPQIIAKLAQENANSVLEHIDKEEKFVLKVDGESFNIVNEHLIVERQVPPQYQETEFRNGLIYLNKELTPELEADGFAREAVRRVQSARKEAGLSKTDSIVLFIRSEIAEMLQGRAEAIKNKVGAAELHIGTEGPDRQFQHKAEAKVRGKEIAVFFDVTSS